MGTAAHLAMLACYSRHMWIRSRPQLQSRSAFMVSALVDAHNKSLGGVQHHRPDVVTENFVKGRGPGGQKINKTRNCVQLTHQPTGVQVQVQDSRSLAANRGMARKRLKQKIKQHSMRELDKR